MSSDEVIRQLSEQPFLHNLYAFAYKRCRSAQEAEDLCSDIVVSVLKSVRKAEQITNIQGYVWTIAHRVYADYCEKRKKQGEAVALTGVEEGYGSQNAYGSNNIDEYMENVSEADELQRIMREISFLAKIYRDVMILYYLDERPIAWIATQLGITEAAVKGRLFSARNTIRNEVDNMDSYKQDLALKPMQIVSIGTGIPNGNDPRSKAERVLSQNVVYLCRNQARTAKELSELLHVPMAFIEDELEIQCRGENGEYGLLKEIGNGKYIANFLLLDLSQYKEASEVYEAHLDEFCTLLETEIAAMSHSILSFPYLSPQTEVSFILWTLINECVWRLDYAVKEKLQQNHFADVIPPSRPFSTAGVATLAGKELHMSFYGCDGISLRQICGYTHVHLENIYGRRMKKHFDCGHHLSTDPLLLLTIRSIGGLSLDSLSYDEKETAAKAIQAGYLRKSGEMLEPNILVIAGKHELAFRSLLYGITDAVEQMAAVIASELATLFKRLAPAHLIGEYRLFSMLAVSSILDSIIERCIANGLLKVPECLTCGEGTLMIIA